MKMFRLFSILLFFSTSLVGCQTPFIDINIGTGSGGGQSQAACYPRFFACPGKKVVTTATKVHEIHSGDPGLKLYILKTEHRTADILVPPSLVTGNVVEGSKVTVESLADGTVHIRKE